MKVKCSHIIFIFSLILIGSLTTTAAYAQEETDPAANEYKDNSNQNSDLNIGDEKSASTDHYKANRDSAHLRVSSPAVVKLKGSDASKPSSSKEEDALSFNFLYYIIQKFKISDLVDE